ncbi:outer membrane lipoprotein carrier protein LolA [Lysobacter niabensis]|uniref:LolA family protein n=1 Tax=Agrilutibacter niabensis TaxID=380628 RepID=UPI00361BB929
MKSLHLQAALLTLAALAALAACKREDTGTQMPAATEAKAPAATASATLASAAEAINPLSAKDEISAMMDRFVAVKSYHVDMNTSSPKGDMAMDMDFVAPDRYRMKMPMGTQYVIGDTMYMAVNGRTMKMALPKGQIANYREPAQIAANKATMTVESLGSDTIDGQAAKKFLVRNTEPRQVESTIWVGADGYPLRIEVNGDAGAQATRTTISYSRFNDPSIRIDPPQ